MRYEKVTELQKEEKVAFGFERRRRVTQAAVKEALRVNLRVFLFFVFFLVALIEFDSG